MRVPGILFSNRRPPRGRRGGPVAPAARERRHASRDPAGGVRDARHPLRLRVPGRRASPRSTSTEGVVSPGGIGYDINCGVRLLRTNLTGGGGPPAASGRSSTPSTAWSRPGVGSKGPVSLGAGEVDEVLAGGARLGGRARLRRSEDLARPGGGGPDGGRREPIGRRRRRPEARASASSGRSARGTTSSRSRRSTRCSTRSSPDAMGLVPGRVVVMLHTGSRGLGHQVATDYIRTMDERLRREGSVARRPPALLRARSPPRRASATSRRWPRARTSPGRTAR